MSSIVHRSRNIRVGRSVRTRKETLDKDVSLDWSKGPRDNLKTILFSVCQRTGITNGQRLSYLHFFTKFCSKVNVINPETVGFSVEEILCCLRVTLFLESAEVRAAGLRAMRYLLMNQGSVEAFYRINLHLLIARSLDIELNNLSERIQCLRLIRKLLAVKPEALPAAIIRCIVAIARDGFVGPDKDSMGRACMGVLAEITLLNPSVCCSSGGITALIDCILMTNQSLNISEALISCLLFLLNDPRLRSNLRKDIDLRQFVAPFTDCHYSLPLLALNTQRRDDISETSEQRETRLTAAKTALLSILRSWPGMLYICKLTENPERSSFNSLCSLIEMLHLPYRDIRKHIIELVFELFYLTIPVWTSNFTVALDSCSPSITQDNWSLYDGFIAAEGRYLLPHISKERANIVDNYLSLLLYTFLTNGLLDGLVDVIIVPSDAENSVRAIILVGELLHLSSHLLPPELAQRYYTLPKLVEAALSTSNTPEQRDIASAAITCLNRMHATKKSRNIPHSLYLSQLIYFCKLSSTSISSSSSSYSSSSTTTLPPYPYSSSSSSNYYHHYNNISTSTNATTTTTSSSSSSHNNSHSSSATSSKSSKSHPSSNQSLSFKSKYRSSSFYSLSSSSNRKENDESTLMIYIRDSQVLKSDPNKWDWNLIGCILKSSSESMRKLDDANYRNFLRKLVAYFKPSNYCFSKLRSDDEDGHDISAIGTYLIDFLLDCDESRASEFINELLSDIGESLSQVTRENNAVPDSILNCTNILRTWSHAYFLFIGRFTVTAKGTKILEKAGIFSLLNDLITCSNNDSYMKLIVSSLNYCNSTGDNNLTRSLFIRILTCKMESARLYATNFMRILLRAGFVDYKKWALGLLTQQLSDESQAVVLAAIDILDESCDSVDNLEALVMLQPNLLRVGDRGLLLLIRYLSIPSGYKFLRDTNFLNFEIDRWRKYFNLKYVRIIEDALNDALSYHQRNDNGSYGRRSEKRMNFKKNVHLPAHFYGELVKHDEGYNLIVQEHFLDPLYQTIREANISTELSVLQLKAALWAIGTVGSSPPGFQLLSESDIIETIVKLTCDSPILSIRGTSFYVLGLLSTTDAGADFLKAYGWEAVRHTREDKWPLCREMIGANAQAGLFLYPHLSVKREHSWSVSSNTTRITDICGVFSGKLKSLNPVNSFVYHGDDGQTPTDDVLYNSLPSFEAHSVFNELKSSTLGKNFTSPQQLDQQHQPVHNHQQQSPPSSLAYHSSDLRPRSSSDSQRCNHDTVEDLPSSSTPDQQSGLWLRDDQIKEKSESHYANHPPPTTSSHKKDGPSQNSLITIDHECSSKNLTSTSTSTNYFSPCSQQSTDSGLVRPSILSSNDRPRRKISEPGHYPTFISPDSLNERKDTSYGNVTDSVKTVSLNAHQDSSSFESALKTGHQKQGYHKRSTSHDQTSHFRELYRSNRGYMGLRDTTLSSIPSAMDVRGYATLRSIQRKRNRSLGIHGQGLTKEEENALLDEYDKEDKAHLECMELPSSTQQTNNTLLSPDGLGEIEDQCAGSYTMEAVRYMGICLPVDLELIFLKKDYPVSSTNEEEEPDKPTSNLSQYHHVRHNDRYHSRVKHKTPPNMSNNSRRGHLDEDGFEYHSLTSCLLCYHNQFINHRGKVISHSVKDSVINDVNDETDDTVPSLDKHDIKRKQTPTTLQEPFFSSFASSSQEKRGNNLPQNSKADSIIEMRREVIRSVSYLLGWYEVIKLAEQNLLSLKQKCPAAFQDICLYSEISIQLASYNFRLPARRFLQELFMDLNFEQLYPDVEAIYERNKPLMKQYFDYTS